MFERVTLIVNSNHGRIWLFAKGGLTQPTRAVKSEPHSGEAIFSFGAILNTLK